MVRHRIAIAVLLTYLCWNALYFLPFTVDDAFIAYRYSRNLAEGHGPVYNPGERVEGYSSFLYMLVSAVVLKLRLPLLLSMKVFGLACVVGLALALHRLCRRLLAGVPWGPGAALLAVALVSTHTSLALWSQAGLETVFFALLIVLTIWRFEVERSRSGAVVPWSAGLVALLLTTRPEAPLYLAYFGWRFLGSRREAAFGANLVRFSAVVLVLGGLYEAWGWSYYGALLPNTHAAKVAGESLASAGPDEMFRGARYLGGFLQDHGAGFGVLLVLGALGAMMPGASPRPPALYIPVLCGLAFVVYAGKDWMPRHRFFVPFLPLLLAAVSLGVFRLWDRVRSRRVLAVPFAAVVLLSGAHYAWVQSFGSAESLSRLKGHEARTGRGWWPADVVERLGQPRYPFATMAMEVVTTTPSGEWVALPDIGFVGFFSDNPIWDSLGLVTTAATAARNDPTEAGIQGAVDDLLGRNPALIVERAAPGNPYLTDFYSALRRDGRIQRDYEADGPFAPFYTRVYRRRGAAPFDAETQLRRAVARLGHPGSLLEDGGLARP